MDNLLRCIAVLCEHERLNLDRNLYVQSEHKKIPPRLRLLLIFQLYAYFCMKYYMTVKQ